MNRKINGIVSEKDCVGVKKEFILTNDEVVLHILYTDISLVSLVLEYDILLAQHILNIEMGSKNTELFLYVD